MKFLTLSVLLFSLNAMADTVACHQEHSQVVAQQTDIDSLSSFAHQRLLRRQLLDSETRYSGLHCQDYAESLQSVVGKCAVMIEKLNNEYEFSELLEKEHPMQDMSEDFELASNTRHRLEAAIEKSSCREIPFSAYEEHKKLAVNGGQCDSLLDQMAELEHRLSPAHLQEMKVVLVSHQNAERTCLEKYSVRNADYQSENQSVN